MTTSIAGKTGVALLTHGRSADETEDWIRAFRRCSTLEDLELVASVDDSPDKPAVRSLLMGNGVPYCGLNNRGSAYCANRGIWALVQLGCDVVITVECDTIPVVVGWDRTWRMAAYTWGHVCYGHPAWSRDGAADPTYTHGTQREQEVGGSPRHPLWCTCLGACVTATRGDAIGHIGYFDPRYYGERRPDAEGGGWSWARGGHGEWTHRYARLNGWPLNAQGERLAPCLRGEAAGVEIIQGQGTSQTEERDRLGAELHASILEGGDPLFRWPWRTEAERDEFQAEAELRS